MNKTALEPQTERDVKYVCVDCGFKTYSDTKPDYVKVMHDHLVEENHQSAKEVKK